MWLLDANSVRLVFFASQDQIPPYAILSHTWSDDEVSFQDIMSMHTGTDLAPKSGWSKIENACRLALSFGLRHVWIDTCCIDKSSSAELQEAINSMFRWYKLASICFAYLADVSASEDLNAEGSPFRSCRWFKRGWTLQELLAPIEVAFYDRIWKPISTRGKITDLIGAITGIRALHLSDAYRDEGISHTLSTISVAERMSWMHSRETTRPEDLAYCLLGIFDINMPMLYGEGSKAFQRLQEEIMKKSDDNTLLSWGYQELYINWRFEEGYLLAPHPSSFGACGDIEPCSIEGFNAASFSMNQRGLQLKIPVCFDLTHQLLAYMILSCCPRLQTEHLPQYNRPRTFVAIPLISASACKEFQRGQGSQKGEYLRPSWCRPILVSEEFASQAQSTSIVIRRCSERLHTFEELPVSISLPRIPITEGYNILGTYPPQPLGSQFISLQADSSQNLPDSAADIPPPADLQNKIPPSIIYSKAQQMMISIRVPILGTFVVVLGYQAVAWRVIQGINAWRCFDTDCRVFKSPDNFGLEALHSLSITQDFTCLLEVDSNFRGDHYIFNIGMPVDAYLMIRLTKDETPSGITDIYISVDHHLHDCHGQGEVERPEGTGIDIFEIVRGLRRRNQFYRKVSPRLLDCVHQRLMESFPTDSTTHS